MNRIAPLAGLLLVSMLTGTIISLQTSQILLPFIVQKEVVYNPANYFNNLTFYESQSGSMTIPNIVQAVVYVGSTTITLSTNVVNTASGFTSLNFTIHFGSIVVTLSGLQNATKTLTLTQGVYPVSLTIDYTTISSIPAVVKGTATITLTAP